MKVSTDRFLKMQAEKTEIEVDGHDKENNQEETSGTEKGEPAVNDDADESSMVFRCNCC